MYLTLLRSVGGSVMFTIPKPILKGLGLGPNMKVGVSVHDGHLIVEPHPRPHYTLTELLAEHGAAPASPEDRQWLEDAPEGREAF